MPPRKMKYIKIYNDMEEESFLNLVNEKGEDEGIPRYPSYS